MLIVLSGRDMPNSCNHMNRWDYSIPNLFGIPIHTRGNRNGDDGEETGKGGDVEEEMEVRERMRTTKEKMFFALGLAHPPHINHICDFRLARWVRAASFELYTESKASHFTSPIFERADIRWIPRR